MAIAKTDPISNKLPAMMINWKNSQAENHTNVWAGIIPPKKLSPLKASLFSEIKTNIMDEVTDSVAGSIQIELIDGSFSNSMGLLLMHCFTGYYATTLLGVPSNKSKFKTDMRISILDLNNKPIKSYRYSLKKSSLQGLYYGKSSKVLSSLLGKEIAEQFKKDLNKDASYISSQLLDKTYYPFGTEAGKHILKAIDLCQDGYYKQSLIELNEAKYSDDLNEYTQGVLEQVYELAYSARQQQLQQRAQAWAAVGAAVAVAGAATAAAVTSSKSKSSSVSGVRNASSGTVSTSSSSSSGDNENDSSSPQEKQKVMKDCAVCHGTGKEPDWNLSEGTGSLTYCSECKRDTNPKHRHIKCKVCNGTGQVFDKYK